MQRIHHHDAPEFPVRQPVDPIRRIHQAHVDQQAIERTRHTQDVRQPDGPHKRRQHQRNQNQRAQQLAPHEIISMRHQGQRQRQHQGREGADTTQQESIHQPLDIDRIPENLDDIGHREGTIRAPESLGKNRNRRIDEEHEEHETHPRGDENRLPAFHGFAPFPSAIRRY